MKQDQQTNSDQLIKEEVRIENVLEVNIDFDEAIREWRSNKKSIGDGHYKYICPIVVNGNMCRKSCYKSDGRCWIHRNKTN